MTGRSSQQQQLNDLVEPVVYSAGYELVELTVTAAGRRSLVRVTVDGENGIDLDGVAVVSRAVSDALDSQTAAGFAGPAGAYVLEVSSPGVDRPLSEPRHYRRAVGRLVTVPVSAVPVTGRVLAVGATALSLEVDGTVREYPWELLGTGRMQVEFSHASQPGSGDSDIDPDDDLDDDDLDDNDSDDDDLDDDDLDDDEFDGDDLDGAESGGAGKDRETTHEEG